MNANERMDGAGALRAVIAGHPDPEARREVEAGLAACPALPEAKRLAGANDGAPTEREQGAAAADACLRPRPLPAERNPTLGPLDDGERRAIGQANRIAAEFAADLLPKYLAGYRAAGRDDLFARPPLALIDEAREEVLDLAAYLAAARARVAEVLADGGGQGALRERLITAEHERDAAQEDADRAAEARDAARSACRNAQARAEHAVAERDEARRDRERAHKTIAEVNEQRDELRRQRDDACEDRNVARQERDQAIKRADEAWAGARRSNERSAAASRDLKQARDERDEARRKAAGQAAPDGVDLARMESERDEAREGWARAEQGEREARADLRRMTEQRDAADADRRAVRDDLGRALRERDEARAAVVRPAAEEAGAEDRRGFAELIADWAAMKHARDAARERAETEHQHADEYADARDAAIERAEAAERERDEAREQVSALLSGDGQGGA